MTLFNSKKDIFNKIGIINSLKQNTVKPVNNFNSFESISNEKDVIKFLLDIFVRVAGTDQLENILSTTFTKILNDYDKSIKEIYTSETIEYNSNESLDFNFLNQGINIPLQKIDDYNIYNTKKTDPVGELLYDNVANGFDNLILNAIQSPNTNIIFGRNYLNFNENTNLLNIKPIGPTTVRSFIYNYVNNLTPINSKKIIAELFDDIFGNISKSMNKSKNQINKEEIDNFYLRKIINNEDININDIDYININKKVNEKYNLTNEIDIGCGFIENNISLDKIIEFSKIDILDFNGFENSLNDIINDVTTNIGDSEIKNNIKNNFIKMLISKFKELIIKDMILSPEKKLFIFLKANIDGNLNNIINLDNKEFLLENMEFIKCIIKEMDSQVNEIIFNYVKKYLTEIIKPVAQKIIKEKIKNYTNIIRSLIT